MLQVIDNICYVLDSYTQADKVGCYACLTQLLVSELAMGMAGGMEHASARIGNMCHDADKLQSIHKLDGSLTVAF